MSFYSESDDICEYLVVATTSLLLLVEHPTNEDAVNPNISDRDKNLFFKAIINLL